MSNRSSRPAKGVHLLASKVGQDSNRPVFAAIFVASVVFNFWIVPNGVDLPNNVSAAWLVPDSPRFLLYISGVAIAVLSLIGFLGTFAKAKTAGERKPFSGLFDFRELAALAILLLTIPLTNWFGLVAAGAGVGAGLLVLSGTKSPIAYIVVAALMPIMVWAFFKYALNVPIPLGQF